EKIKTVGEALGVSASADALAEQVTLDLKNTAAAVARQTAEPKRVLFVLSTRGGRIMASGADTAAHGIIEMAGGVNAIDSFSGYKPLSDEAVTSAAPDVILMMDRGDHSVADEDLFSLPAIVTTPAAETRSVVRMNGLYLLGFGPRTAQAASDLNRYLYGNS
ncbi:MAG: ABC transporter substrate-binding protein, partial [Pseudomonadota bacterium]